MEGYPDVTLVDIGAIKPRASNPRIHTAAQVAKIAASITEWGWTMPLLVDEERVLIAGHGRLEAAKLLGADVVPVTTARGWTEAQKRAYVIADNQLTLAGSWDPALLKLEATELDGLDFDLELLGFSSAELAQLLPPEVREVEVPDVPEVPVTKLGDLITLGEHRLLCGDSTDEETTKRLFGGEVVGLMFTDPPYGIGYDSNYKGRDGAPNPHRSIQGDGEVDANLLATALRLTACPVFVCSRWDVASKWVHVIETHGRTVKNCAVWVKPNHGMGDLSGAMGSKWEAVIFAHDGSFEFGGKRPTDVWDDVGHIFTSGHRNHPTEKPVKLPAKALGMVPGDVFDPFLGSGTTLIAAEQLGRRCYGMELDPGYCDVIVQRWETLTGNKAVRPDDAARAAAILG